MPRGGLYPPLSHLGLVGLFTFRMMDNCHNCGGDTKKTLVSNFQKGFYYYECLQGCKKTRSLIPFWQQECKDLCEPASGKRKNTAGHWIYREYCLSCGKHSTQAQKKNSNAVESTSEYEKYEISKKAASHLFDEYSKKALNEQEKAGATLQRIAYYNYLNSAKWEAKRIAVLNRDNHVCQACLGSRATEVHHRTYDNIGEEPMFDLISLCARCHDKIHDLEKKDLWKLLIEKYK